MKDQGQAFLDRASAPLKPNEDDLTIIVMATVAAGEDGRTCNPPSK
jgi:hypothetical protein